jgi:hypothetical protein
VARFTSDKRLRWLLNERPGKPRRRSEYVWEEKPRFPVGNRVPCVLPVVTSLSFILVKGKVAPVN